MISIKNYIVIFFVSLLSGAVGACLDVKDQKTIIETVPSHVQNMTLEYILNRKIDSLKELFFPSPNHKKDTFDTRHVLKIEEVSNTHRKP